MTAVLLVALYALAPPLLLWRYYRLAGHGVWWDVALAMNVAVNAGAAGHFAWDEWMKFEPGHWAFRLGDRLGPTALIVTLALALILAAKPWPRVAGTPGVRGARRARGRVEPPVAGKAIQGESRR